MNFLNFFFRKCECLTFSPVLDHFPDSEIRNYLLFFLILFSRKRKIKKKVIR